MSDLREAAEMALDALDIYREHNEENIGLADAAYEALRQALAQPEQEPVAWVNHDKDGEIEWGRNGYRLPVGTPLYAVPPKRKWVDLTDDEVVNLKLQGRDLEFVSMSGLRRFAKDIEAKLKEKNT